eukprot:14992-Heterococcus_DN1.PRE.1
MILVDAGSLYSTVLERTGPGALTPSGPVRGPMGGGPQQGGHYSQNQPQQPYGQQQHRPQQPSQQQQHQQQQQGQYGQQPEEGGGWTGGIKNLFGKVFVSEGDGGSGVGGVQGGVPSFRPKGSTLAKKHAAHATARAHTAVKRRANFACSLAQLAVEAHYYVASSHIIASPAAACDCCVTYLGCSARQRQCVVVMTSSGSNSVCVAAESGVPDALCKLMHSTLNSLSIPLVRCLSRASALRAASVSHHDAG